MSRRQSESEVRLRLARALWGWEPHPTQRRWLLCDAKTKVASCGRRWGKTEAAAIDASTMALIRPGFTQMIVSPTYDQSRLIFDTVERLMMGSPFTKPLVKVVRTPYPRLTVFGSVITARTADEDGRNLRGNAADRVIVDEAAFVRDSVIHEVVSPMLADRNGQLVMISTPFGKNHFYQAFIRGQGIGNREQTGKTPSPEVRPELVEGESWSEVSTPSPGEPAPKNFGEVWGEVSAPSPGGEGWGEGARCASFSFPSWANPHISREYIEEQRQVLSPRQFAVEYEARFIDDQSAVFAWEEIEAAACAENRGQGTGNRGEEAETVVAGIDWARYSDYTAVIAIGVGESRCAVVGMDRFNGMGWNLQIQRVIEFLRTHHVSAALADQTSVGDPLLEQLRSMLWESGVDVAVEGYGFTNQSKRDLIEHLALRFAQSTITIPRDEHLMRELQYFEYELTSSGNVRMNARSGCHDDLVIALALACWQAKSVGTGEGYLARNGRVAIRGW